MSKITSLTELQDYCRQYYVLHGHDCSYIALPLDEYLAVANDVYSNSLHFGATAQSIPSLQSVSIAMPHGILDVSPLSVDGKVLLSHDGVLREYGSKLLNCVNGVIELRVGPFRYPCTPPAASAGVSSLVNTGPTSATQIQYGLYKPPADAEPECACNSKQLASTGHDNSCAWINWKRGKK